MTIAIRAPMLMQWLLILGAITGASVGYKTRDYTASRQMRQMSLRKAKETLAALDKAEDACAEKIEALEANVQSLGSTVHRWQLMYKARAAAQPTITEEKQ